MTMNRQHQIILLMLLGLAASCASVPEAPIQTKTFQDNGAQLVNPGMGFCHYAYAGRLWAYGSKIPAYDTMDWFPGCSTVYMRLLWSDVEPQEGQFRWDILDRYAMPWILAGKKIAIRIICCNQTCEACPDYVREAGAKGHTFVYTRPGTGLTWPPRWEPEYDDPVFIEKLSNFIQAFAVRYDGDPNVAFVDVGSFGIYGEGHSQYLDQMLKEEPEKYNAQAQVHLRLWRQYMPHTYLVVSDDIGGNWNTDPDHPNMQAARELGIGFRDDSIFCQIPYWYHDGWARQFALTAPVVLETGHLTELGPDSVIEGKKGQWNPDVLLQCVEDHRASYFSIHDYPDVHLARYRSYLEAVGLRLGYRFVLEQVSYPSEVRPDESISISSVWHNAGVAPCYAGAHLTWSLLDKKGNLCWSVTDGKFNFRSLEPTIGGKEHPVTIASTVTFGHTQENPMPDNCLVWAQQTGRNPGDVQVMLPAGKYTLCVSVGSAMGIPQIALPLDGDTARRIYPVGTVRVLESDSYSQASK